MYDMLQWCSTLMNNTKIITEKLLVARNIHPPHKTITKNYRHRTTVSLIVRMPCC